MNRVSFFNTLEPGLALSGAPETTSAGLRDFDVIINVCDFCTPEYTAAIAPSVRLVRRPFEDNLPAPLAFIRAAALELADCRIQGMNTLVHCRAGQSRSPTVVALYWMGRDGICWEEALRRIRTIRLQVDPHPLLLNPSARVLVAEDVRTFLAGRAALLEQARAAADALVLAHHARGVRVSDPSRGWDEIEPGLACGVRPHSAAERGAFGFERILDLTSRSNVQHTNVSDREVIGCGLRQEGPVEPEACQAAVELLQRLRREGRSVLVCCGDGKSLSALVAALFLMADRSWDFASAMWYIRQRRQGAWPRPQTLQGLKIPGYCD
jgi:protein-tyrosine phosphatase